MAFADTRLQLGIGQATLDLNPDFVKTTAMLESWWFAVGAVAARWKGRNES